MVFGDGAERGSGGGLWYATQLFILLLVLPGAYLGYEQWRTMRDEREAALSALPTEVIGSADRLVLAIRARYEELLEAEMHRPFWHYRKEYRPISTQGKDLALVHCIRRVQHPPQRASSPKGNNTPNTPALKTLMMKFLR